MASWRSGDADKHGPRFPFSRQSGAIQRHPPWSPPVIDLSDDEEDVVILGVYPHQISISESWQVWSAAMEKMKGKIKLYRKDMVKLQAKHKSMKLGWKESGRPSMQSRPFMQSGRPFRQRGRPFRQRKRTFMQSGRPSTSSDEDVSIRRIVFHSSDASLQPQRCESRSVVKCRVCQNDYNEVQSKKVFMMSLKCGHLMCESCVKAARVAMKCSCPVCAKKFRVDNVHPIFP